MANLGVFGGTFDPPHIGHLILAQSAYKRLHLDKLIFIPAGKQPHKQNQKITYSNNRLEMLKLAIEDDNRFSISDIELQDDGVSFSYKTLIRLNKIYPESQLFFIIGGDNISDIQTWMKPEEIFKLAKVAAAMRPDYKLSGEYKDNVILFDMPQIEISSTKIREMVKQKQSIKYLVPERVESYILKNKLYSDE